jgi:HSP20 family molecular chaperone IbpA
MALAVPQLLFRYGPISKSQSRIHGVPAVDVTETEKCYKVTAELPGMDEKNIEVKIANGMLTIKGQKQEEKEEEKQDYYVRERSFGSFERTFPVPEGVDLDKVDASFKKGVLTVTLRKTAEAQKEEKKITVRPSDLCCWVDFSLKVLITEHCYALLSIGWNPAYADGILASCNRIILATTCATSSSSAIPRQQEFERNLQINATPQQMAGQRSDRRVAFASLDALAHQLPPIFQRTPRAQPARQYGHARNYLLLFLGWQDFLRAHLINQAVSFEIDQMRSLFIVSQIRANPLRHDHYKGAVIHVHPVPSTNQFIRRVSNEWTVGIDR